MPMESIYMQLGYTSRRDYLRFMSDDYGVPLETVYALASILGPIEDFDGLINALEDAAEEIYE